jgi:hypothetical protein
MLAVIVHCRLLALLHGFRPSSVNASSGEKEVRPAVRQLLSAAIYYGCGPGCLRAARILKIRWDAWGSLKVPTSSAESDRHHCRLSYRLRPQGLTFTLVRDVRGNQK